MGVVNQWFRKQAENLGLLTSNDPAEAIADLSLTGTYSGDDADIETAVNGILAVLRDKGLIKP